LGDAVHLDQFLFQKRRHALGQHTIQKLDVLRAEIRERAVIHRDPAADPLERNFAVLAAATVQFPAAKKASLTLPDLIDTLAGVNQETASGGPISLMVNWGRLLINGDSPLVALDQILVSEVPLAGVILSGAGASADGYRDSHNSHLDPDTGCLSFIPDRHGTCRDSIVLWSPENVNEESFHGDGDNSFDRTIVSGIGSLSRREIEKRTYCRGETVVIRDEFGCFDLRF